MQNNALCGTRQTFSIFPLQLKEVCNQTHHSKLVEELPSGRDIYGLCKENLSLNKGTNAFGIVKNKIWSRAAECKSVKVTNTFCNVHNETSNIPTGMVCISFKENCSDDLLFQTMLDSSENV